MELVLKAWGEFGLGPTCSLVDIVRDRPRLARKLVQREISCHSEKECSRRPNLLSALSLKCAEIGLLRHVLNIAGIKKESCEKPLQEIAVLNEGCAHSR